jgi:hypothetical protein
MPANIVQQYEQIRAEKAHYLRFEHSWKSSNRVISSIYTRVHRGGRVRRFADLEWM